MQAYRMNKCRNTTFKTVLDYIENRMNDNDGGVITNDHYLGLDHIYCDFKSPSGQLISSNSYSEPKSFQFFYDLIKAYDGYTSYLATGEIYEVFTLVESSTTWVPYTDVNGLHTGFSKYFSFTVERYHYHSEERHDCCD